MNIFYWSPFFDKIATVKSVIKSAESIIKYRKDNSNNNVTLIDSIGEWDSYKDQINNKIKVIKLNKKNYTNIILKGGFIKSRISYLFIFFLNFFKLVKLINKDKPDFLIIHLMTSLPIFLSLFFNKKTKIILRISGLPKLNLLRLYFWKFFSKNIYKVTCPTKSTYQYISKKNIFHKKKIFILNDPVINIKDFITKKKDKIDEKTFLNKKILISIGRLTVQKNFSFLISSFQKIVRKYPEYILIILGEGEQRKELESLILNLKLNDKVYMLGYQNNVYKFLNIADCFILSSLWEDPGFVLIEAALNNVNIISSDCPNGPREILPKNGILFVNNDKNDFIAKFEKFKTMKSDELYRNKLNTKKNIKKFTLFQHFKNLNNILN